MSADYHYIEAEGQAMAHLSRRGGVFKALCGKAPFPEDWHHPVKRTKTPCLGCVNRMRRESK